MKDHKYDPEENAKQDCVAPMAPIAPLHDEETSTLTVVGVAMAALIEHGMGRDEQVQRMTDELRASYRQNRWMDEQRRYDRLKTLDILKQMESLEEIANTRGDAITQLMAGIAHRDDLLAQAHSLIKRVDTNRMAPNSDRLVWRRERTAFFKGCEEKADPASSSQGTVTHTHGSHGEHTHTAIEYLRHDRPIDDEVKILRDGPAPAPDDATIARLQEEMHVARRALRDARNAKAIAEREARRDRREQYGHAMAEPPAVQVSDEDELEEEDEPEIDDEP